MTHTPNEDEQYKNVDWIARDSAGKIQRRTIVQGAAWTIPVVATAVGAPLAAASNNEPTLTFTNGPYSSVGCAPLGAVTLLLTTDGTTPDPNKLVTVTLPDGLTWTDGTTGAKSFPTNASGVATIPAGTIAGPAAGGDFTIAAQDPTGTATASAPVAVTSNGVAHRGNIDGTTTTYGSDAAIPNVPAGSTAIEGNLFLAPNGDLYNGGQLIASNVSSAGSQYISGSNRWQVVYVSNGAARTGNVSGTTGNYDYASDRAVANVPAGSTAIEGGLFLAPNGNLYNGGALIASNVTSAGSQYISASNRWQVNYVATTAC